MLIAILVLTIFICIGLILGFIEAKSTEKKEAKMKPVWKNDFEKMRKEENTKKIKISHTKNKNKQVE